MRREAVISSVDFAQFRLPWGGQGHALIVVLRHSRLMRLMEARCGSA